MAEQTRHLIAGEWVGGSKGETFERLNPADTHQRVAVVAKATEEDVDRAVQAARTAFASWRLTPAPRRAEILYRAAELLCRRKEELGRLVTREMGKVLLEGLGDVQEAIDMAYYMAGEGRRMAGETVPSELLNKDTKSIRVPIGVFALITPWNFPIAIPAWKLFPALVCGNTVVFKPSMYTPLCATRLVEILQEAGSPPGVLNMVHGSGDEVGERLVVHAGVDAVSFTGSCPVGERLAQICAANNKTLAAEMGGKNPILVMNDADLSLALEGVLWGGFGTTGQRCTAASRVIVHEAVYTTFRDKLVSAASRLRLGDGLRPETQVGPLVNTDQMERVLRYVEIGKKEGAKLLLGGHRVTAGDCAHGYFVAPTIFADVAPTMRIAQEEIFGPVVALIPAKDFTHAIEVANGTTFGLSAALYSRDVNKTAVAERDLDFGLVYINASTIGAEIQLPFGGTKRSGLGHREAGGRGGAIDLFSKVKVIYRDFSGKLQRAQIDKE